MISQTAEYALRAIVFLAMNTGSAFTTQQIAETTKVPSAYLSKVLKSLVRAGLLQSRRGLGGGFVLAKPAEEMNILQVLNAVDPIQRIRTCPLGLKAYGTVLCALHKRLDDATAIIEKSFADTTIAELLARPTPSIPLYEFPPGKSVDACACG
ncbi:MAG: Rrf2 family transcriptional regulator [Candidatus Obscuribacterales bacterium]|nr:Rrf2 family transcriptional regulator [Candidatus Obscuribacterales bacterium]